MCGKTRDAEAIQSARTARRVILAVTILQGLFTWILPLTFGNASDIARTIGYQAGRELVIAWALAFCILHALAFQWPWYQKAGGLIHGFGCLMIGARLIFAAHSWAGGTIAAIGLFGFYLFFSAPGRNGWK